MTTLVRPIRIGIDKSDSRPNKQGKLQPCVFTYNSIKRLYPRYWDGWIKVEEALPLPFDMVYMDRGKNIIAGWWNGMHWEGISLKEEDFVTAWKFKGDYG